MVYYSETKPRPHLRRARRPDAARIARPAERKRRPVGQRTRQAVFDVAAGDHEASRRAVGCRARRTREERPHRKLPPARGTDARRQRLAQPLPEILDRATRSTRCVSGGRHMATVTTKPSLTIKRRFNAPPEKVFAAWTDPEKVKRWMGPGEIKAAARGKRSAHRWPLPLGDASAGRRRTRRQRRLSRSDPEREAGVHLGLEVDAGA